MLLNKSFFGDFPQSDIDDWNISVGTVGLKQTVKYKYTLPPLNFIIYIPISILIYTFIPELTQVRIRANIYFLDDWTSKKIIIY